MASQVPNIFVEQYDQGQKKIRADLMDENFAYVCSQIDATITPAEAAHAAMPSGQTIALSVPARNGTVTAPGDGYIVISASSGQIDTFSVGLLGPTISSRSWVTATYAGATALVYIPVSSGDVVTVQYPIGGTVGLLNFVYANSQVTSV